MAKPAAENRRKRLRPHAIKRERSPSLEIVSDTIFTSSLGRKGKELQHESKSPEIEFSSGSNRLPVSRMKDKGKGRAMDGVTITNKLKVDKIECLTAVPSTWTVPREKTAYLVDLMEMDEAPTKSSGNILSLNAYICAEVCCLNGLPTLRIITCSLGSRIMGWFVWTY
jgi:hypothetical protein